VKCGRDAVEAAEWRDRGWNSVHWAGPVPDDEIRELVDASYDAVVAALPKGRRPTTHG
jgi:predicted DNA-binding protein (MmcQ/YjbR family)